MQVKVPTQLTKEEIQEFKALHEAATGELLSDDEANKEALTILTFFAMLIEPEDEL